jgi:hypothetical protein
VSVAAGSHGRAVARAPAAIATDRDAHPAYVGLVTRAIAFALDAALVNLVAILAAGVVMLTFSIVTVPEDLRAVAAVAGGVVYVLWVIG